MPSLGGDAGCRRAAADYRVGVGLWQHCASELGGARAPPRGTTAVLGLRAARRRRDKRRDIPGCGGTVSRVACRPSRAVAPIAGGSGCRDPRSSSAHSAAATVTGVSADLSDSPRTPTFLAGGALSLTALMGWGSIPLTIVCPILLLGFCAVLVGLQYVVLRISAQHTQTKEDNMEASSNSKFIRTRALTLSLLTTTGAVGAGVVSGFLTSWNGPSG